MVLVGARLHEGPGTIQHIVDPHIVQKFFAASGHVLRQVLACESTKLLAVVVNVVTDAAVVSKADVSGCNASENDHVLLVDGDSEAVVAHLEGTYGGVVTATLTRTVAYVVVLGTYPRESRLHLPLQSHLLLVGCVRGIAYRTGLLLQVVHIALDLVDLVSALSGVVSVVQDGCVAVPVVGQRSFVDAHAVAQIRLAIGHYVVVGGLFDCVAPVLPVVGADRAEEQK